MATTEQNFSQIKKYVQGEIFFRRLDEIMKLMNEFQIYFCDLGEFKRPTVNNSLNQSVRLFAF